MRYYVISTFGGIYLDLDVQCMRPLLLWADGYGCFMSEETHEHAYLVSFKLTIHSYISTVSTKSTLPLQQVILSLMLSVKLLYFSKIWPRR